MGKKKQANIATEIRNIKKAMVECREKLYFLSNMENSKEVLMQNEETINKLQVLQERLNQKQNIGGI